MDIILFNDLTTEQVLQEIETEGKKYDGLYVDMDNAPERKYVKEHASKITDLIKKLDRARIDKSKQYKAQVEKEFADIKERLEIANSPFTLLLDEYKAKRAKELADKKAIEDAIELSKQIEEDHEIALLMNKTFEFDRAEELRIQKERDDKIAEESAALAIEQERQNQARIKQDEINAENARLANVEHVRSVNNVILEAMLIHGFDKSNSIEFIKSVARKEIKELTINY